MGAKNVTFNLDRFIPAGAEDLIWDEFFRSRNRGVDRATHLPWTKQPGALCATAVTDGWTVGTLLVKCAPNINTALIGYVCVHPSFRGQNLSRLLIEYTAEILATSGFGQMILWTGNPQIYEGSGFTTKAVEQNLRLQLRPLVSSSPIDLTPWPGPQDHNVGLPPYAYAGWCARSREATIIFVDTPGGPTLLANTGPASSVIETMGITRSGTWSATVYPDDAVAIYAEEKNLVIDCEDGPATMVRLLNELSNLSCKIPVSERI